MNRISFCILIFQLYGYPGAFTFCVLLHTYIRTSEIRVMHPCISLILAAVRLKPRITVDMADHPAGIHLESRRNSLRMKLSARYRGKAVVHALKHLVAHEACSETFRPVEFEQVRLRLRMSVRKIPRQFPLSFRTSPSTMLDSGEMSWSKMVFTRRFATLPNLPTLE